MPSPSPPGLFPPQQSLPEVTAQATGPEVAPEAKLEEVEASPVQGTDVPGRGTGLPSESEVSAEPSVDEAQAGRQPSVKEGDVDPRVSSAQPTDPAAATTQTKEGEAVPEPSTLVQETDAPSIAGSEVKGADVTVPSPAESSADASSTDAGEPVAPAPVSSPPAPATEPAEVAAAAKMAELTLKDVFFDFDQAVLREDARKVLADNAQWLRANPAAKVAIEGHCDERGSSEYNLALGERRARATREYLVAAGISESRISTISYGKERPFVLGHDESAWKWNRRAHFVATTK
jgi:peptidoglycan-associated lipoprotein